MLNTVNAMPTIGVRNLKAARAFYEGKLGFKPIESPMPEEVQIYKCGETKIEVYHSEFAGSNKATVLTWAVGDNVRNEVDALKKKGIIFEHYSFPQTKMDGDIHVMGGIRAAWFKDPDGNILSIVSH